jgi:hypothetical protein
VIHQCQSQLLLLWRWILHGVTNQKTFSELQLSQRRICWWVTDLNFFRKIIWTTLVVTLETVSGHYPLRLRKCGCPLYYYLKGKLPFGTPLLICGLNCWSQLNSPFIVRAIPYNLKQCLRATKYKNIVFVESTFVRKERNVSGLTCLHNMVAPLAKANQLRLSIVLYSQDRSNYISVSHALPLLRLFPHAELQLLLVEPLC